MADNYVRMFSMSYPELVGFCNHIHNCMLRDAVEFGGYGINSAAIVSFADKIDDFQDIPSDDELSADVVNATQNKNAIADELRITLRSFATRAKLVFGEDAGIYSRFATKDISHTNNQELLSFSQKVQRSAVLYKTELLTAGVTQLMIDNLKTKNDEFETALDTQDLAIVARDDASNNRVKKANELYSLVTKYCDVGKTIWYETNEARYNDYVVFQGTSPGSLDKPSGISFNLANMKISWSALENATSYIASISTDGGASYQEVYSGSDTFFVYQPTYFGEIAILIKGHNSGGNGPASDPYTFTYFDVLPSPEGLTISLVSETTGLIRLNFEEVASATAYKIFRSVVGLGMPAGEFVYITEQPEIEYVGNTTSGMRNYFYVKAGNATQLSVASSAVLMDMAVVPV